MVAGEEEVVGEEVAEVVAEVEFHVAAAPVVGAWEEVVLPVREAEEEGFLRAVPPAAGICNPIAQARRKADKALASSGRKVGKAPVSSGRKADKAPVSSGRKAGRTTPPTTMITMALMAVVGPTRPGL